MLFRGRARQRVGTTQLYPVVLIPLGVVINAVVCGAVSGPHDRYEARVAWLVPFVAIALLLEIARSGRGSERGSDAPARSS
jgi:hypothetical protein